MTKLLAAPDLSAQIEAKFPNATIVDDGTDIHVAPETLHQVCRFLHDDASLAFDFLVSLTSVDYIDYFEVVYRLVSIRHNHSVVLKTKVFDRDEPTVPSVAAIWKGAELQEREVYDLMGVSFKDHPNLKRIMLWEGFDGHPLRRDFLMQRP